MQFLEKEIKASDQMIFNSNLYRPGYVVGKIFRLYKERYTGSL